MSFTLLYFAINEEMQSTATGQGVHMSWGNMDPYINKCKDVSRKFYTCNYDDHDGVANSSANLVSFN